ncbi:MAG: ATP-binding protein [Burkholderiales bacterium]|nr:ATP-binding protein [Burkholderiales bacterium]
MQIKPIPEVDAPALLQALLGSGETNKCEFKRVSGKMVSKALETICAFANTEGGVLALGVADLKEATGLARLFGVEENAEAVDEFQRKLITELEPKLDKVDLMRLDCRLHSGVAADRPGHILLVRVPQSQRVHSLRHGGTFARLGCGNTQLNAEEVVQLSYRRGVRSAASEPVPVALDRLRTDAW